LASCGEFSLTSAQQLVARPAAGLLQSQNPSVRFELFQHLSAVAVFGVPF
jgi:hypothetical protein